MADAIISADQVFDFMGSPATVRDNQDNIDIIEALIDEQQETLENMLGRAIFEPLEITDQMFGQGIDSEINGRQMFLTGKYRDIIEITSVKEGDTTLSEATASLRDNDYLLDKRMGMLLRIDQDWDDSDFIMISGKFGYLNDDETPKEVIKSIVKEMVAVKSRLWKTFVTTEMAGKVETIRQALSDDTEKLIKRLRPAKA